jgi:hypothetical protein
MKIIAAKIISRIFNPLFITFYYLLITINLKTQFMMSVPVSARWMLLSMVLITTYILPGLLMGIFSALITKRVAFSNREIKIAQLFIAGLFYFLTYHLLSKVQLSPVFNLFILGSTSLIGACILITLVSNISVYMTAMGALVGALLGVSIVLNINLLGFIIMALLFAGLVGFSRLALGHHRPLEVYSGFLLGVAGMLIHFLFV